jgi:hypothetical protein
MDIKTKIGLRIKEIRTEKELMQETTLRFIPFPLL